MKTCSWYSRSTARNVRRMCSRPSGREPGGFSTRSIFPCRCLVMIWTRQCSDEDAGTVAFLAIRQWPSCLLSMTNHHWRHVHDAFDKLTFHWVVNLSPLHEFGCELLTHCIFYEYNSLTNGVYIRNFSNVTSCTRNSIPRVESLGVWI